MMRQIDQLRMKAQVDLANRITRHGEIDFEQAIKERLALADRVDGYRAGFIYWMRKHGWPQVVIDGELLDLDDLCAELRVEPFSRSALGGLARMLG